MADYFDDDDLIDLVKSLGKFEVTRNVTGSSREISSHPWHEDGTDL